MSERIEARMDAPNRLCLHPGCPIRPEYYLNWYDLLGRHVPQSFRQSGCAVEAANDDEDFVRFG
jgi:hypothetical protein